MAVSKRTRFEVLRRDNHACRYCGATAPDVALTVDHVLPVALGGTDDPGNLVAACRECNSGKASTGPSEKLVVDVQDDAIRWAAARHRAIEARRARKDEEEELLVQFCLAWIEWDPKHVYLPADALDAVRYWLADGLEVDEVVQALHIALDKRHVKHQDVFRYMAGICKNKIAEIDALTMAELGAQ